MPVRSLRDAEARVKPSAVDAVLARVRDEPLTVTTADMRALVGEVIRLRALVAELKGRARA
jgi:hypothetical protein